MFKTAGILLYAMLSLNGQTAEPREFTISTDVNLVLLDVSVRNADGSVASGLSREAFTVLEDGRPQAITQFTSQDLPVTMGLIVDNSGSMRPKRPEVLTAALILMKASDPSDELFVINFNDAVKFGLPAGAPFSDDTRVLWQALSRDDPQGKTALYDGILAGLDQLEKGRRAKKTLVVVSDGGDNASHHSFRQTLDAVLRSRATIYTIGLFDADNKDSNLLVLKKLAHLSGGICYLPRQLSEVEEIGREIARDVRMRYTIGYLPRNLSTPGLRNIKVEVHERARRKLVARTRTSYVVENLSR